jgi:hypothetical protein
MPSTDWRQSTGPSRKIWNSGHFFPIRCSFLNWCGQHFDVQQATSIKRTARMPTIAEQSAMQTRLNSQNFALNGQSGLTNLPMTDASSAVSIGMTHEFMPVAKTIDHLTGLGPLPKENGRAGHCDRRCSWYDMMSAIEVTADKGPERIGVSF